MRKYHVNDAGKVGICKAVIKCQFSSNSQHYETKDKAREAFEGSMKLELVPTVGNSKSVASNKLNTILNRIQEEARTVTLPDFSPNGGGHEAPLCVTDLTSSDTAGGNCFTVTQALAEYLTNVCNLDVEIIKTEMSDKSTHWAVIVNEKVLDYSFRQFEEDSEIPVVTDKNDWLERVEFGAQKNYQISIVNTVIARHEDSLTYAFAKEIEGKFD